MGDVLFLAHRIPYPPDRGDKIRSWNLLRHLTERSRVHLVCFADDDEDLRHFGALRNALGFGLGESHAEIRRFRPLSLARSLARGEPLSLGLFDSASLKRKVEDVLKRRPIETIIAFSSQMAQFVPDPLPCRFAMDFVDMDSAKFEAYGKKGLSPRAILFRREARRLFAFETATARRADASLFVSEAEAELFRSQTGAANVYAISNGIDLDFYRPDAAFERLDHAGPLIVFTGQMDYRPNVDAVTSFARDVMPTIRMHVPQARFAIVGRKPAAAVQALGSEPGVIVTGAVQDVRSWLSMADVVVAPLGIARGIQNKVLEAMAMARPVVASPQAFEGIDAQPDRDLLVVPTAAEQADAVLSLLQDPVRAASIGAAARVRMESAYSWDSRLAPLDALLGITAQKAAA